MARLTETAGTAGNVAAPDSETQAYITRAVARWPRVPAVFGWLRLTARGEWRIRPAAGDPHEPIGNRALTAFLHRVYRSDASGCWYCQNGPQRAYVDLDYTPLVFRTDGGDFVDQGGCRLGTLKGAWLDDHGGLLLEGVRGPGVVDDRDLGAILQCLVDADGVPLGDRVLDIVGRTAPACGGAGGVQGYIVAGDARVPLGTAPRAQMARRLGFEPRPGTRSRSQSGVNGCQGT